MRRINCLREISKEVVDFGIEDIFGFVLNLRFAYAAIVGYKFDAEVVNNYVVDCTLSKLDFGDYKVNYDKVEDSLCFSACGSNGFEIKTDDLRKIVVEVREKILKQKD